MSNAFEYVAHTGKLVFVGITTDEVHFAHPLMHRREMTLFASRNALPADFGRIIGLIEEGRIDTRPWITHRTPFEEHDRRVPVVHEAGNGRDQGHGRGGMTWPMRSSVTISLVPEVRGGPFVFWDDLAAGAARRSDLGFDAVEVFPSRAPGVSRRGAAPAARRDGIESSPRWAPGRAGCIAS